MHNFHKHAGTSLLTFLLSVLLISPLLISTPVSPTRTASASFAPIEEGTEPLPPGVHIETVIENMESPVAYAFDPDGRIFYTEKGTGNVRLFANGVLQPEPVITFQVSFCSERGLLGIAIDPNFAANHYFYVYYTE